MGVVLNGGGEGVFASWRGDTNPFGTNTVWGYIIVPEEIPISIRNKLYVQFNRRMEDQLKRAETGANVVPLEVLERYKDTKNSRGKKFILFKQFVEDPTCLSVFVAEKHETTNV